MIDRLQNYDDEILADKFVYNFKQEKTSILSNCYGPLPEKIVLPAEHILVNDKVIALPATEYDSVENAYHAWKLLDLNLRQFFSHIGPLQAKDISVHPEFVARPDMTDQRCLEVMFDLLKQKFENSVFLAVMLLIEEDQSILKGEYWKDTMFGDDFKTLPKENYLGKLLLVIKYDMKYSDLNKTFAELKQNYDLDFAFLWQEQENIEEETAL
ncbi:MAG TPA: hypothetical protein DCL21_05235 [Alphaproteobacteria bacterium]|nr:hypothetical protein [Alphaproteobacteria bacterium]